MRMKTRETESIIEWIHPITNESILTIRVDDVHSSLRNAVFRYGLRQIVADAGAMSKSARISDRVDAMRRRAAALRDGTWGTRAVAFPDADLFATLVECGTLRDTDATRAAWRGLSGAQRRAAFAAAGEPARRALERIRPAAAPETGAAVLAALMGAGGRAGAPARSTDDMDGDDTPADDGDTDDVADDEPTADDATDDADDADMTDADDDTIGDEPIDAIALGIDAVTDRADRAD